MCSSKNRELVALLECRDLDIGSNFELKGKIDSNGAWVIMHTDLSRGTNDMYSFQTEFEMDADYYEWIKKEN